MGQAPKQQTQPRSRLRSRMLTVVVGAAALAVVAAGCGGSSGSSSSNTGGTKVKGGTAVYALPPSGVPNYIFPYTSSAEFSDINSGYLQFLLYRPLYWFGQGETPNYNASLSVANAPTFSGNKVTITLKPYKWSNGQPVTAQNVMFWLNMEAAVPSDYGGYTGFPAKHREGRQGGQPDSADHDDGQGVLAQLVPVQRAGADLPDAGGEDRVGRAIYDDRQRLAKAVYRLDVQSKFAEQLRLLADLFIGDGPWS